MGASTLGEESSSSPEIPQRRMPAADPRAPSHGRQLLRRTFWGASRGGKGWGLEGNECGSEGERDDVERQVGRGAFAGVGTSQPATLTGLDLFDRWFQVSLPIHRSLRLRK